MTTSDYVKRNTHSGVCNNDEPILKIAQTVKVEDHLYSADSKQTENRKQPRKYLFSETVIDYQLLIKGIINLYYVLIAQL